MATIDDILAFEWPENCNSQEGAMHNLLTMIDTLVDEWDAATPPVLQLNQSSSPGSGDWESLWLSEGNSLPISENATLLWFDTSENDSTFGGIWTVFNGKVVRNEYRFYRGRSDFVPFVWEMSQAQWTGSPPPATTAIDTPPGNGPFAPMTFTIQHAAKLVMQLFYGIDIPSGAAIIAYHLVKLHYRLDAVYQIIDQTQANSGLFAVDVTHPATTPSDNSCIEQLWMHPTALTIGQHTIDFWALETTSYAFEKVKFAPTLLPQPGYDAITLQVEPAWTWELIYE